MVAPLTHGFADPLSKEQLIEAFRNIYLSRRLDDKEIALKRQNRIYFQISGAGHEGILTAAGLALRPAHDYAICYYRDRALMLQLGMTAEEVLLAAVGAKADVTSGGRQMPCHWGCKRLNVLSKSSCTGTQFLQGVGAAEASWYRERVEEAENLIDGHGDEVVIISTGEGATSEGEFFEALNTACNKKLPTIFLVEDNGYAISVPVEVQTAGGSISALVENYPNLLIKRVDGCDVVASYDAMTEAVEWCRARRGPALVHASVIRPYSHSMSDDERAYRPDNERQAEHERDPINVHSSFLLEAGYLDQAGLDAIKAEVDAAVDAATDAALAAETPVPEEVYDYIYSHDVDPTSDAFDTEDTLENDEGNKTMVDLLNRCLHDELARDPRVVVFGQDVADASREEVLDECKGKGGVFKVTHGLQSAFGMNRVFNSPLAEANIVGRAIGMAERGMRPVVEIQFLDYIWPAFQQIRNELATSRWRSHNSWPAPVVIRTPSGGYLKGGAPYHSQSAETLFTHIPGLRVVMPATALDANGLLRTAIRCDDPVIFLEPKHLYRQTYNKGPNPGADYMIPFGKGRRVLSGDEITVVTYGALVHRSTQAIRALGKRRLVDADLIDLRTLSPYDWPMIAESVKRTGKLLVVHEETKAWGYGAEIASRAADELFEWLDAPVRRVAALDSFVAYHPTLEDTILPQVADVEAAVEALLDY
ncbi:MAG: dehydrogenase E1 component subunit alpha/beta [Myxococcota bacterium]|nr:dehydrogenase E1 component subunit alpha/beta [Myxococcota bacterium]